ncbi:MAG: hypothetical protein A2857_06880 [Candidatus Levybacteria bacterium RIFCSPHIGHO2_01_FULL_36_15]|nr:MAG: hypothetical protein A2857_06880 [Candidatus Levybacteria bacterium RIFCSPHIGHO2_01_FULL_36_15]
MTVIKSKQIKGKGRGKKIGFPTINLEIPENLELSSGIYAARVKIDQKIFLAALHFGPVPTFAEEKKSLEIFLIDADPKNFPQTQNRQIEVNVITRVREVKKFNSIKDLRNQIESDVKIIKNMLIESLNH